MTCQFSVFHLISQQNPRNIFSAERRRLIHWSHYVENLILEQKLQTPVYAGLQSTRHFGPIHARYQQIARVAGDVFVFGVPDVHYKVAEGIQFVDLSLLDPLTREWFVIFQHEKEARALLAVERTRPENPMRRSFEGILTSDRGMIAEVIRQLEDHYNLTPSAKIK